MFTHSLTHPHRNPCPKAFLKQNEFTVHFWNPPLFSLFLSSLLSLPSSLPNSLIPLSFPSASSFHSDILPASLLTDFLFSPYSLLPLSRFHTPISSPHTSSHFPHFLALSVPFCVLHPLPSLCYFKSILSHPASTVCDSDMQLLKLGKKTHCRTKMAVETCELKDVWAVILTDIFS